MHVSTGTQGSKTEEELLAEGRTQSEIDEGKRKSAAIRKAMSEPGKLGLPALLEERRLEFGIIDAAFAIQAAYDRVFCWQIPEHTEETYLKGGTIIMPENTAARKQTENPKGVIVSAGLQALDVLHSHGMDLGHIVMFVRMAPWAPVFDNIDGYECRVTVISAGDIVGSVDTATELRAGRLVNSRDYDVEGAPHIYKMQDFSLGIPQTPWRSSDY